VLDVLVVLSVLDVRGRRRSSTVVVAIATTTVMTKATGHQPSAHQPHGSA
jgi:hypothetical protein